jgi:hypothetical protein
MNKTIAIFLSVITLGLITLFYGTYMFDKSTYNVIKYYSNNIKKFKYLDKISDSKHLMKFGKKEYLFSFDGLGYLTIYDGINRYDLENPILLEYGSSKYVDYQTHKMFLNIKKWIFIKSKKHDQKFKDFICQKTI